MKPPPVRHHPFADSGYTDGTSKPQRICGTCDMPESDRRHQLPPTTPDAKALEQRRTGDR